MMRRTERRVCTLKIKNGNSTIAVNGNKMILAFTPPSGDKEKVAFVMPTYMVRQLLEICNCFNAGRSANIGDYFGGLINAVWYHYDKDEFYEVEQHKTKCTVSLHGYCTGEGLFLNVRVKTEAIRFVVQYNLNLWQQRESVREIARQLMPYNK